MAFFHEAGHAQHFGNEDHPALDYVERAVSTSNALTEIYSFLLEHLTQNRAWLTGVVGLPEATAGEVAYYAGLTGAFFVGRYASKLAYELDFFEDLLAEGRNQRLYTTTLSAATHFVYTPQNYLNDMDPATTRRLPASLDHRSDAQAHLEETYGEDWFGPP